MAMSFRDLMRTGFEKTWHFCIIQNIIAERVWFRTMANLEKNCVFLILSLDIIWYINQMQDAILEFFDVF